MSFARFSQKLHFLVVIVVIVATVVASAAIPQGARAASVCFVDDDASSPTPDGLSWETAFPFLQDAIASPECTQEIWVAVGTYSPTTGTDRDATFLLPDGVAVYGGFNGTELDRSERVLALTDDDFANDSILSGNIGDPETDADNSYHVLRIHDTSSPNTILDGFVIQDGRADIVTVNPPANYSPTGGGLAINRGTATLQNLWFRNNFAGERGGGLSSGDSTLSVQDVVLENNLSLGGGALHDFQGANTYNNITIRNNHATQRGGGAYFYNSSSTMTISWFTGNQTDGDGGALFVDAGAPSFDNVTFTANNANGLPSSSGGAIVIGANSTPSFSSVLVNENNANSNGGGIFSAGSPLLDAVIIADNIAGSLDVNGDPVTYAMGGGMYITTGSPLLNNVWVLSNMASNRGGGLALVDGTTAQIANSVIDANRTVASGGGGITVEGASAPVIVNSVIVNNNVQSTAGFGGGLLAMNGSATPAVTVTNTILWGNTRMDPAFEPNQIQRDDPTVLNLTYSDIEGGYAGTGNLNVDPLFVDVDGEDNAMGTTDDDLHLLTTSPVIDAGSNAAVPGGLSVDFDGQARFVDMLNIANTGEGTAPIVDMGADEVPAPDLAVAKTVNPTSVGEAGSAEYTITILNQGVGAAHEVAISDPLPTGLTLLSGPTLSPDSAGMAGTAPVLFEGITLFSGESVTVTYTVRGEDGPLTANNTATVTATEIPLGVTASAALTVNNLDPVVDAGPNQTVNEGQIVTFAGTAADVPGDPLSYSWTFGDDGTASGSLTPTHTYADNGSFTATLTVTDDDGGTGTDTLTVTVNNLPPANVNAGPDQTANEGDAVHFTGSATDVAGDPLSYTWDFGDGTTTTGQSPTHVFTDNGIFTVTLTASDDDNGSATDTLTVTVNNVAPTIGAGPDQTADEGVEVSFSGTASDPGADTLTYSWNFGDTGTATGTLTPTHTYTDNGSFTVTLTVDDGDGGVVTDTLTVTVNNVDPVIEAGTDQTVNEGVVVSFNATAADVAGDLPLDITWNFGDGGTATGTLMPTHTYTDNGSYTVTLTVNDGDGGSAADSLIVTVNNVLPVINAGSNQTVDEGVVVNFSGTATDVAGDLPLDITWDFGDGGTATGTLTPTHTYNDNGSYTVTLTVNDGDGADVTDTLTVTVNNADPVINAGPNQTVNEGQVVTFAGTASDVPGDTLSYSWTFGDGGTASGSLTPTHAYADNGSYTVTLTVTDEDGGSASDTLTVTVNNVNPVVNAGADQTANEGDLLTFAGSATDAGSADTLTYSWNFGDGSAPVTGANTTHAYADNGTYTVTLTVTDDDGGSSSDTLEVVVANVDPAANAGPDITVAEGAVLNFPGGYTDPGTGDTFTFTWAFGDGDSSSLQNPTHTYDDNGVYTVTFTVLDDDGGTDTDLLTVTVTNAAPVVNAGNNANIKPGETVDFNGSYTDAGANDAPFTISWDFGDGATQTGTLTPSHTFDRPGTFHVTLTVTDKDGGIGSSFVTIEVSQFNIFIPMAFR